MKRLSPFWLLREALRIVRLALAPAVLMLLGFHLVLLIVVSPLIAWLFREALRANGMLALDLGSLQFTGGIGITVALLLVILLLAFWIGVVQFVVLVQLLRQAQAGQHIGVRSVFDGLKRVVKKLLRPSSIALIFYLFFILPISGFGFVSVLSQGIAVPSFISGELMKSPLNATIWVCFMLLIALLNLRFSASLPLFVLTDATGGRAMRLSFRLTRGWTAVQLVFAAIIVLVVAAIATLILVAFTIVPTAITDEAAPAASPAVAAFSLGIAQFFGMLLTAVVTAVFVAVLLALVERRKDQLPLGTQLVRGEGDPRGTEAMAPAQDAPTIDAPKSRHPVAWIVAAGVVIAVVLGFVHVDTMQRLSQHPHTLIIAHRGFSDQGAENTIGGLEAAAAAGADLVEIDVMQTADKRFVVMHDSSLSRLAGIDSMVKDLTLDELTEITVRDLLGHEGKIPSLEQYINRAHELEMPLLIEIKLGGLDTPDFVDLLVTELNELDAIQGNIFHTLDHASVERLKLLRPDAAVGYILAFAGVDVPDTVADFLVIEEWSATQEMQDAAARAGLGFFSWTVNDEAAMHELLRRDIDGIITDHPDLTLAARVEMSEETGLAGVLVDALMKFVVVF